MTDASCSSRRDQLSKVIERMIPSLWLAWLLPLLTAPPMDFAIVACEKFAIGVAAAGAATHHRME
jgi:hypothetical protein